MLSFSSMPTKLTKKSRRFNRATEVFSFSYYNFSLFYVFLTFFYVKKKNSRQLSCREFMYSTASYDAGRFRSAILLRNGQRDRTVGHLKNQHCRYGYSYREP